MEMQGWPCKCAWGCPGGRECSGNEKFRNKLRDRCIYCQEVGGKNCIIYEKCDSVSCKGSCPFHAKDDSTTPAGTPAPRPRTPQGRESTPAGSSRNRATRTREVTDTPVSQINLNRFAQEYTFEGQAETTQRREDTPCPEEEMVDHVPETPIQNFQNRQEDDRNRGATTPTQKEQEEGRAENPQIQVATEPTKTTKESKPHGLLKSLLDIQANKEKKRLRKEAVLKTFAERLANDFQNMERLTNMKLGATMKQVFLIVSDAINLTNRETGAAGHVRDKTDPPREEAGTGRKEESTSTGPKSKAPIDRGPKKNNNGKPKGKGDQSQDETAKTAMLWTQVLKKNFRPQDQQEEKKAGKVVSAPCIPKQDNRISLRFNGYFPDEVETEHNVRRTLSQEEAKGLVRVVLTRKAMALVVKDKEGVETIMKKKAEVMAATKAEAMENSERWEKFIFRGVTRIRNISGQGAQLNQADVASELSKQGEPQPKKIVITGSGLDQKCNVIVFTSEGQNLKRNTTLFGDRIGAVKMMEKSAPRFCRNCQMHHPGLCRKESKCQKCGRASHGDCQNTVRCSTCHGEHLSTDRKCPLRPKRVEGKWIYPNEWIMNSRRKQEREETKKRATAKKTAEQNKDNQEKAKDGRAKGKERTQGPSEWN